VERAEKEKIVDKFEEELPQAQSIVLTNQTGIDANTIDEVRSEFRDNDVHYHVVKNTLAKIAIEDTDVEPLSELFRYPTAIAYSFEDAAMPAKIVRDFEEEIEAFELKGGFINGDVIEPETVRQLADMPSKDKLRRKLLGLFESAQTKFLRLLETPSRDLLNVLEARKDDLDEE
jgi:large subunit ribosomal protein L10